MDDHLPPPPPTTKPREIVDPGRLATDISICLQLARTRTLRDSLAREAFKLVAETIVEHFMARGYEVTAPNSQRIGPGPQPVFSTPPNVQRED